MDGSLDPIPPQILAKADLPLSGAITEVIPPASSVPVTGSHCTDSLAHGDAAFPTQSKEHGAALQVTMFLVWIPFLPESSPERLLAGQAQAMPALPAPCQLPACHRLLLL